MKPYEIKRALFIGGVMLPCLIVTQYLGYTSMWIPAVTAGVSSGVSVVLFPNPDFKP